jgi:DUF1009 family protein
MEKIGLIAGNRRFPILFAEAAKKRSYEIVAVAVKRETSARLKNYVDKIYWLGLDEFGRLFEIFRSEGISDLAMAGQISPRRLFSKEILKSRGLQELLENLEDKRADTIFAAVARKIEACGFRLLDSTIFLKEYMPQQGVLTKKQPDFRQWEDIYFGLEIAKNSASLDIGQVVAVKHKAIVAVEALEGTDSLIRRAGRLARSGISVVKVSKPKQDMRFDIPVVGVNTIKALRAAQAACLAIEAGRTLFLDCQKAVNLADNWGLAVVAV